MGILNDRAITYVKTLDALAPEVVKLEPVMLGLKYKAPDGSEFVKGHTLAEKKAFMLKLKALKQAETTAWATLKSEVLDKV